MKIVKMKLLIMIVIQRLAKMKNRKGFVFAETVVVISVVAVALLSLYTVFYTFVQQYATFLI